MSTEDSNIFIGRPSKALIFIEIIFMLILFVLLFISLLVFDQMLHIEKYWNIFGYLCYSLLGILAIYRVFKVIVKIYSVKYILKEETLEVQTGLLSVRTDVLQLYRVKDIADYQSFLFRFFNIGNIMLVSTDLTNPNITLIAIANFKELKNKIQDLVEHTRGNAVLETI